MLGFLFNSLALFATEGGSKGGFLEFYNNYLNYPGFEFWKFLNLAIFFSLLAYLLKKPLSENFRAKREKIRGELIRAEEEKKAALAKLTSAESRLASLDAEKQLVLLKAKEEADFETQRLAKETEFEVARLKEQTAGEISRYAKQAKAELRRFSAEESVRLAEEKIRSRINAESDGLLVKDGIRSIGGLS